MNEIKYLIIPDIHGRTFWKKDLDVTKYEKIIFLGDYLDPYEFEGISEKEAIENFKDIIKFKKDNRDKVILLLGNHDIYYYAKKWGPSRYSREHAKEIEKLFEENRGMFSLAYETKYDLYTHSGILQGWFDRINKMRETKYELEPLGLKASEIDLLLSGIDDCSDDTSLFDVSRMRGGNKDYGSCIWADVNEHDYNEEYKGKYQIFGHTLQLNLKKYYETYKQTDIADGKPIITDKYAMLDCRHKFEYTVIESEGTNEVQRHFDIIK